MMQLELRRYWYASEFHTARSSGALGSFYCDHPDEVLLVIDGTALSKMPTELIASMDISASLDGKRIINTRKFLQMKMLATATKQASPCKDQ